MKHSTLLFLLGAASVSNAYVQLVMRSADKKSPTPLNEYLIASTPSGLTAVRNANALQVGEADFWSATWTVYHNPGSGRGKCNTIPCKYPIDRIDGDFTMYNMHEAVKAKRTHRRLSPTDPNYLERLDFLGVTEGKEDEREMGVFTPSYEGRMRTKVHKWWSGHHSGERTDWRFLSFMDYNTWKMPSETVLLRDQDVEFHHDGGGKSWVVCYKETKDLDSIPIQLLPASHKQTTSTLNCDPIKLYARVLLPTFGNYNQMRNAETHRRVKESILVGSSEDEVSGTFSFDESGGIRGVDFDSKEEEEVVRQRITAMDGSNWEEKLAENPRCADGTRKGIRKTLWKC